MKNNSLKAEWLSKIGNYKKSNLMIEKWCQVNEVPKSKFYYWLRIFGEEKPNTS